MIRETRATLVKKAIKVSLERQALLAKQALKVLRGHRVTRVRRVSLAQQLVLVSIQKHFIGNTQR